MNTKEDGIEILIVKDSFTNAVISFFEVADEVG